MCNMTGSNIGWVLLLSRHKIPDKEHECKHGQNGVVADLTTLSRVEVRR